MKRVDNARAVGFKFVNGDLNNGILPTWIKAEWLNVVQEELAYVIENSGLSLAQDDSTFTDLYLAIVKIVTDNASQTVLPQISSSTPAIDKVPITLVGEDILHNDWLPNANTSTGVQEAGKFILSDSSGRLDNTFLAGDPSFNSMTFGDASTDGSWRIVMDSNDLYLEQRSSGNWQRVTKWASTF